MLSILRAWRLRKGHFSDLGAVEAAPEAVRSLRLHGSSWNTEDHSFERCRHILPRCSQMTEFEIGWLNWTRFPPELASIPRLESVASLNAAIKDFPYFLGACPRLRCLAIRGGNIQLINESVFALKAVRNLDLANNPLTQIPDNLETRLGLKHLGLHDTPLLLAPRGIQWTRWDYPDGIPMKCQKRAKIIDPN